jgi:hypothetical protein
MDILLKSIKSFWRWILASPQKSTCLASEKKHSELTPWNREAWFEIRSAYQSKFSESRGLQKFACVPGKFCRILHAKIFGVNMYGFKSGISSRVSYLMSTKAEASARNSTSFHRRLSGRISFTAKPNAYPSTSGRPGICGPIGNSTDV